MQHTTLHDENILSTPVMNIMKDYEHHRKGNETKTEETPLTWRRYGVVAGTHSLGWDV